MSTTMVAVILSACVMQEVSGTFLSRADSKDDVSCDQCLAAANKFLGSDCKDMRCLVQTFAAKQKDFMASADQREKAFTAVQIFQDCAKKNQCDVKDGTAAAEEFHIKFDELVNLLQVQVENKESEDSQDEESEDSEKEESEDSENEESEDSHGLSRADSKDDVSCDQCLASANEFLGSDCKDLRCLVQTFAAKQKDFMASADQRKKAFTAVQIFQDCAEKNQCDVKDGTAAAEELNIKFDDLVSLVQSGDSQDEESEDSQDEESEDSQREESEVSENEETEDSHGSVAAQDSHGSDGDAQGMVTFVNVNGPQNEVPEWTKKAELIDGPEAESEPESDSV